MTRTFLARATLASLALAAMLGGCTRIQDTRGYLYDPVMTGAVTVNVDNKASVMKMLGRPSFESEFDKNNWYYVSQRTMQFAFRTPTPASHQVMVVRFDDKDTVKSVEFIGLDQTVSIDPSSDITPTRGREVGWIETLFGNIGRVSSGGVPGGGPGGGGGPPQ